MLYENSSFHPSQNRIIDCSVQRRIGQKKKNNWLGNLTPAPVSVLCSYGCYLKVSHMITALSCHIHTFKKYSCCINCFTGIYIKFQDVSFGIHCCSCTWNWFCCWNKILLTDSICAVQNDRIMCRRIYSWQNLFYHIIHCVLKVVRVQF